MNDIDTVSLHLVPTVCTSTVDDVLSIRGSGMTCAVSGDKSGADGEEEESYTHRF